jgi:hypothetical protein
VVDLYRSENDFINFKKHKYFVFSNKHSFCTQNSPNFVLKLKEKTDFPKVQKWIKLQQYPFRQGSSNLELSIIPKNIIFVFKHMLLFVRFFPLFHKFLLFTSNKFGFNLIHNENGSFFLFC